MKEHSSNVHKDVPNKPGKTNWVEQTGHLPDYIRRIAKHLIADEGYTTSRAIATAVNTVKRWAKGGGNVSAATRAKAAKAVAEWEAKKARAHSLSNPVDLAEPYVPGANSKRKPPAKKKKKPEERKTAAETGAKWAHGWVPLNDAAKAEAARRGMMSDPKKDPKYQKLAAEEAKKKAEKAATAGKSAKRPLSAEPGETKADKMSFRARRIEARARLIRARASKIEAKKKLAEAKTPEPRSSTTKPPAKAPEKAPAKPAANAPRPASVGKQRDENAAKGRETVKKQIAATKDPRKVAELEAQDAQLEAVQIRRRLKAEKDPAKRKQLEAELKTVRAKLQKKLKEAHG